MYSELGKDVENMAKSSTHKVLAHSYLFYFMSFLLGIFLDFIFPIKVFTKDGSLYFGIFLIFISSLLILWAQKTSRNLDVSISDNFKKGPYRYMRGPTHLGLTSLFVGFGILINGTFVILFTLIAFLITKRTFLKKQEMLLEKKYGDIYARYKNLVKF
ncbi:hypothetical protein K8Q94_01470 [Candidatus Nomurabacteria bacterium]|nr:hypothetical protein [Candidatus Nomurabacteria bacterium]